MAAQSSCAEVIVVGLAGTVEVQRRRDGEEQREGF
jgi:hypothetical protein